MPVPDPDPEIVLEVGDTYVYCFAFGADEPYVPEGLVPLTVQFGDSCRVTYAATKRVTFYESEMRGEDRSFERYREGLLDLADYRQYLIRRLNETKGSKPDA